MAVDKRNSYQEQRLKTSPVVITVFLLAAIVMFSVGIPRYLKTKEFIDNSVSTIGIISEIEKGTQRTRAGRKKIAYYAIYTFITKNGVEIKGKSSVPRGPSEFKINDQVTILYNPENTNNSKLKTFSDLWLEAFLLNLLAFVFSIASIFVLKKYKQYLANRSSGL